jgi:hypothetical protein
MPAKPQWMLQIPMILEQLQALDVPVVDRSVCERVFGVRRRQAVKLMHQFGGYRSGNAFLVDRAELIIQLGAIEAGSEVKRELRRKARLAEKIENLRRYRVAASVHIAVLPVPADSLPDGIDFGGGRITVEFGTVENLLSKLYALAQTAAGDFEGFRTAVEAGQPGACTVRIQPS